VRYVFRNNTGHDIDATVAFPLPEVNGGDLENVPMQLPSKDPVNFVDFKISVDGRPVQPSVEVGASFKKKDITDRLAGLGRLPWRTNSLRRPSPGFPARSKPN
jgi:hypothetical protein